MLVLSLSSAVNAQSLTLVASAQSNIHSNTELIFQLDTKLVNKLDTELDNKSNTQLSPALVSVLKTELKPELQPELKPFNHVQPLRIAVAANFSPVLEHLLTKFTEKTGIQTQVISGASGAIFLQIKYGAPFDVFLSADSSRPIQLEQSGHALSGSRATYASGRLAFYSATMAITSIDTLVTELSIQLSNKPRPRLAMANPNVAPYGKAAKEALQHMQLWQSYQSLLITGVNISQTFTQLRSKSINQGFIAYSQLKANNLTGVLIPASYHQPIKQQLVILKNTRQPDAALAFRQFLLSDQTQAFIERSGYTTLNQEAK
jgi:molybdate transport system substrate-binding protein